MELGGKKQQKIPKKRDMLHCKCYKRLTTVHFVQYDVLLYSNKYVSIKSFIKNRAIYSCILLLVSIVFIRSGKNTDAFRMSFLIFYSPQSSGKLKWRRMTSPVF